MLYIERIDKGLFHCDNCGIYRVADREYYFHCKKFECIGHFFVCVLVQCGFIIFYRAR
ncbi:putative Zinc finger, CTCHY-type [Helianthus annuus]|nr:putative Zinc finger, CTCHY-type [Helianthus annuus]